MLGPEVLEKVEVVDVFRVGDKYLFGSPDVAAAEAKRLMGSAPAAAKLNVVSSGDHVELATNAAVQGDVLMATPAKNAINLGTDFIPADPGSAASLALKDGVVVNEAASMSQIPMMASDITSAAQSTELFPKGLYDRDDQQVDLRTQNSWNLEMGQISTVEMMECHVINSFAPWVLISELKSLMEASGPVDGSTLPEGNFFDKYVVNVSAMEGQFYRNKTIFHPHTNMAKASLNMMTRTAAAGFAAVGIFMTAVDTGWITDEQPQHLWEKRANQPPPLDEWDAAMRVLDPVMCGVRGEEKNTPRMRPHSLFIWILCLLRDVVYSQPATGSLVKYWGGPLLTQPVIQPIWIGNYAYKNQTINFYTQLFKSRMMTMLTQYYQLADNGTKTYVSPARLLTPIDATGLTDSKGKRIDIESGEQLVARLVDIGKLPAKTRNTLYVFHYGADQSTLSSSVFNCTETASYHKYFSWSLSTGELLDITYYIVVKPCAEQVFKCLDAEGFDNLSCVMTHEIMEAIVDPGPTPGWTGYVKGSSVEADPLTAEAETVSFYEQLIKSQLMTVMTEYYQIEASGTKTYINIPQTVLPAVDATGTTDRSGKLIEAEQGAQIIDALKKRNALPATTPATVYVFHFGEDQTTG
ncbi:hypothetical protein HDU99_001040, partial [Rhizoclosmatium hyalinum]